MYGRRGAVAAVSGSSECVQDPADRKEVRWLRLAAHKHWVDAQFSFGVSYAFGRGEMKGSANSGPSYREAGGSRSTSANRSTGRSLLVHWALLSTSHSCRRESPPRKMLGDICHIQMSRTPEYQPDSRVEVGPADAQERDAAWRKPSPIARNSDKRRNEMDPKAPPRAAVAWAWRSQP